MGAKIFEGPVYLEPEKHIYIHRETGEHYTSVTKVIHDYVNVFEEDKIAEAISKRHPSRQKEKYKGLSKAQILEYWQRLNDEANEYGTLIHETIETFLLKNKFYFPSDPLQKKVIKAFLELGMDEGECVWPERIMFSKKHKLAGTADLKIDINHDYFDIGDWKTNAEFNFFDAFGFKTLKAPLNHLQDCHYSIYSIQLSIYAYMYELETGKKCRQIWIGYWNRETETFSKIPITYLKHEAKQVLEQHRFKSQFDI
jgi:hypothetical protein